MDLSQFTHDTPATRHDGWSPALKVKFLDHLSAKGTVRAACALVGLSREAAYRLRRRDPLFARGWNAALALARENGVDVLACHALDGIEEQVWYRGELVGVRIRHDARLLLAHLGRLDRLAEASPAGADAGRFDELLAVIGGAQPPECVPCDEDGMPINRDDTCQAAADCARDQCWDSADVVTDEDGCLSEEAYAALDSKAEREALAAGLAAAARWDEWFRRACGVVDAAAGLPLNTLSTVSTSHPPGHGEDACAPA